MANPKLFVSLPVRGYDDDEVRAAMLDIKQFTEGIYDREFELIDSLEVEDLPGDVQHDNYYLGKAIQKLATADICAFHPDWRSAPGCMIEHMVCAMYDIPYIEIKRQIVQDEKDPDDSDQSLRLVDID